MEIRAPLDRSLLVDVLDTVLARLDGVLAESDYRLVGTAAAVLLGAPIHAADIDLLMRERRGVDRFAEALSGFRCETAPGLLPGSVQYFARFELGSAVVEASTVERPTTSECVEVVGAGPWVHFTRVLVGARTMPVIRMELRLATELARRRGDRYGPLIDWMKERDVDLDLLQRAMAALDVPEGVQRNTLACLRGNRCPAG